MSVQVSIVEGPLPAEPPTRVEGAGAVLSFEGVVRPTEAEEPIAGLTYETYDPMAAQQLQRLGRAAVGRFGLLALSVEHSRGWVPNFACSFRLQVASAHRKEALAAMDWFIDRMKQDVPIWKRPAPASPRREASS